jgi:hypothetical protein
MSSPQEEIQSIHVQVLLQSMVGRKYGTSYTGG